MRYLEHLDGLLGLIDREFGEMEQAGKFRGKDDIELAYKMMDIAKDAAEFCEKTCEMNGGNGYSEYGRVFNPYSMNGRNQSMGYSNTGNYYPQPSYTYGNNGMRQSYGTDSKNDYLNHLRMKAENEPDDRTRDHLMRMIQELEQMK